MAYPFTLWVLASQLLRWLVRGGRKAQGVRPSQGGAKEQAARAHAAPQPANPPRRKVKRVFLELP